MMQIGILIIALMIVTFFGANQLVYAQVITNSTPSVIVLPPNTGTAQAVATDPVSLASIIVTSIGIPLVGAFLYKKDDKTKEAAKEMHGENEFRLEASSEALTEMNNSLKATDQAAVEHLKVTQGILLMISQKKELKDFFNEHKIDGVGLIDFANKLLADSESDLEKYYQDSGLVKDRFDRCNDGIVKTFTAVRNKSIKNN